jgi:thymidylate kinase
VILAIEGPTCTGKTTLACALRDATPAAAQIGWSAPHGRIDRQALRPRTEGRYELLQGEYARLETMRPASVAEELALQRGYLNLVLARVHAIRSAAERADLVIADRDVWSFFAHGWARFQGPFESGREAFGALFGEIAADAAYVADLTVLLEVPYSIWLARAARRGRRPHPLLFDQAFYGALQEGYRQAVSLLGDAGMVLDGEMPLEISTEQVRARVDVRRHAPRLNARAVLERACSMFTS